MTVLFDGGLNKIGVAFYDCSGHLVAAMGKHNKGWSTNNIAELAAAEFAVSTALQFEWQCDYQYIQFLGDSQLIINFLKRSY